MLLLLKLLCPHWDPSLKNFILHIQLHSLLFKKCFWVQTVFGSLSFPYFKLDAVTTTLKLFLSTFSLSSIYLPSKNKGVPSHIFPKLRSVVIVQHHRYMPSAQDMICHQACVWVVCTNEAGYVRYQALLVRSLPRYLDENEQASHWILLQIIIFLLYPKFHRHTDTLKLTSSTMLKLFSIQSRLYWFGIQ